MSEPCSFTALVRMAPEAFAAAMRSDAADDLAVAIAHSVSDGSKDVAVVRYLKKEASVLLLWYFWCPEPLEALLKSAVVAALLRLAAFKDVGGTDRAAVSDDANNFNQTGPKVGFRFMPGRVDRDDRFDPDEVEAFDHLQRQHFFRHLDRIERGNGQWFDDKRLLDPKLACKVAEVLEGRRRQIARESLPTATPLEPVRLFDKFHYNGLFVVHATPSMSVPLPSVDPYALRQTKYGAADAEHVIVGRSVIETDPTRFKVLKNDSATFYATSDRVYNGELEAIDKADPKTFKLVGAYARDKKRWYDSRGMALDDVGDNARVDATLYFLPWTLLLGDRSVYLGSQRLQVDAGSCKLVRAVAKRRDPFNGGLIWLRDKAGDCIVTCIGAFGRPSTHTLQRTDDPLRLWQEEESTWDRLTTSDDPINTLQKETRDLRKAVGDDPQSLVTVFEAWASENLDPLWSDDRYNAVLWDAIEEYLQALIQVEAYDHAFTFFQRISSDAWFRPQIYVHAILALLEQQGAADAGRELVNLVRYHYTAASVIAKHPPIQSLIDEPDQSHLKEYAAYAGALQGRGPPLPVELATLWLENTPENAKHGVLRHFFCHFRMPRPELFEAVRQHNEGRAQHYETEIARLLNASIVDVATRQLTAYDARKNYANWRSLPGLSPAVHLAAATALFSEGFLWIDQSTAKLPRPEFPEALAALRTARMLGSATEWANDASWRGMSRDPLYEPYLRLAAFADD